MITTKQAEAIRKVIASDCTASGTLCDELSSEQCIQGGLAVAACCLLPAAVARF